MTTRQVHPSIHRSICLAIPALLFAGSSSVSANLLTNGGFEDGPIESNIVQLNSGQLPPWTLSNDTWAWYMTNGAGYGIAQEGTAFINVTSPFLEQGFSVTAGQTYTVSYVEALRADGNGQPDTLNATISLAAGVASGTTSQNANNPLTNAIITNWAPFNFSFTPNTTTTATLRFALANGAGYPVLDNVSVDAVPEPASLSLIGLGACGLWASGRRRNG